MLDLDIDISIIQDQARHEAQQVVDEVSEWVMIDAPTLAAGLEAGRRLRQQLTDIDARLMELDRKHDEALSARESAQQAVYRARQTALNDWEPALKEAREALDHHTAEAGRLYTEREALLPERDALAKHIRAACRAVAFGRPDLTRPRPPAHDVQE